MELKVYKSMRSQECYAVGNESKYIFWDYLAGMWREMGHSSWRNRLERHPIDVAVRESSWLEILIITGTTQKQVEVRFREICK